jgi:glutathione S-transferase
MKLFHAQYACSTAPYIVINELGLNCDIVKTNMADRTELLKFNPQGKVPTLVLDNGQVLTECAVIMQYLADQKPEAGILPKVGTWERYKTLEATNYVATELHKSLGALFARDITEEAKAFSKNAAMQKLTYLNNTLGQQQFLACNQFSIADIYCFVVVSWTKVLGFDMSQFPNVLGYCERIATRPSIAKTMGM